MMKKKQAMKRLGADIANKSKSPKMETCLLSHLICSLPGYRYLDQMIRINYHNLFINANIFIYIIKINN